MSSSGGGSIILESTKTGKKINFFEEELISLIEHLPDGEIKTKLLSLLED